MRNAPSVFISYSWDSAAHKKWVRMLAERLIRNGVRVWLDQLNLRPGESLTRFMEAKIKSSGHVLVICTPSYAKRSNKRVGGVGYEQQIISGRIAAGISRRKFIPIIRAGEIKPGPRCAIPDHFIGIYALDMRAKRLDTNKFEDLLRAIFNKKKLIRSNRARQNVGLIRLPSLKLDGWHLLSGVASHRRYPKTFWIPPERKRTNLKSGDIAKMIFDIKEPDGVFGVRMWVKVTGRSGPYYLGDLSNQPVAARKNLMWGSPVVFLPEHVIDIVPLAEANRITYRRRRARKTVANS
jgi:TIR domain